MAIRNICTIVTESVVPQTKMELVVISVMDQVKISVATALVPDVKSVHVSSNVVYWVAISSSYILIDFLFLGSGFIMKSPI